jgi:DNA polymerase III subunit gamma/tau
MSYLVLARKYRPQTFAEVLEQGPITRTLSNALSAGRVAHALLFTGPRGTGKTTIARIMAKAINCDGGPKAEPCNQCSSCRDITAGRAVDVYEIDGASNNSVDQIRELRENLKYMPAHSRYKIYIIDEVHMLSSAAFNALLKTLEEPPAHVMFMFATTEPHKIPITILSRCQRFDLRRVRLTSVASHLSSVCRQEEVEISPESLELIARESGGSVRDSLSLLDQVLSGGQRNIPHDQVLETLGVIDRSQLYELAGAILTGDASRFLETLDDIYDRGHDLKKLFSDLLEYLRDLWVIQTSRSADKLVDLPGNEIERMRAQAGQIPRSALEHALDLLFREEATVRLSPQPKLALEMAFFGLMQMRGVLSIDTLITKLEDLRQEVHGDGLPQPPVDARRQPKPEIDRERSAVASAYGGAPLPAAPRAVAESPAKSVAPAVTGETVWQRVIQLVARSQPSLAATLKRCVLKKGGGDQVEILVSGNSFVAQKLKQEKTVAVIKKACAEVYGGTPEVIVTVAPEESGSTSDRRDNHQTRMNQALSHPVIVEAVDLFNGTVVDVKVSQEVTK